MVSKRSTAAILEDVDLLSKIEELCTDEDRPSKSAKKKDMSHTKRDLIVDSSKQLIN